MNEKLLIIEDEPNMLRLLGMTLQKEGYQIAVAQSAAAARTQLQAATPDLIILDVMLPGVSGLDLCQELRRQPSTATVPILMLSALGEVQDKVAGLKAGADEYVVKPVDSLELVARVAGLLERVRRMRGEVAGEAAKVISFLGSKGGLGTTTTLINVGALLAQEGKRTIAVELRPELGHLHALLGLGAGETTKSVYALEPARLQPGIVSDWLVRHASGLQVIPAPAGTRAEARIEPAAAAALVAALKGLADVLLLDLPPFPRPESEAALGASDMVLLTMEPTRVGLEAAAGMADYVKAHARPAANLSVVVINRAPLATPVGGRQIQERIGWPVVGGVPPAPDECARAQQLGVPVSQMAPESTLAQATKELAHALLRQGKQN